ncbi:MAG: glutamine amidotransferase [Actinobacteria bacterium]|nr:glutamine amidotransferase [Actinomycetota bacterium]
MSVSICRIYPDVLGTYGDGGNAVVLAKRLQWRGHEAEIVDVRTGDPVPATCDLYVLGGGEDDPQTTAANALAVDNALGRAIDAGAVVFAVCAGYQILGTTFNGSDGPRPGLGLADWATTTRPRHRPVGELLVEPSPELELPTLTGYENHASLTVLGPEARPLGTVASGVGNGDGSEGAIQGRILGTYMHGPALARNAALADLVLSWIVGPLGPLDDEEPEDLRRERITSARSSRRRWFARR